MPFACGAWTKRASARSGAICASFVRVSPVNLVLSGLLRRLLNGDRPPGHARVTAGWAPPPSVGALPPLVEPRGVAPAQQAVLASLGTTVDGQPFVPGLYRMLAALAGLPRAHRHRAASAA